MKSAPDVTDGVETPNGGSLHPAGSVWRPAADYKRKPGSWWTGRRVKLLRVIRTRGGDEYRKGRIVKVARKFGGLTLKGRNLHVTRVGYYGLMVDATPNDQAHTLRREPTNENAENK